MLCVGNPNKIKSIFSKLAKKFNILNQEVTLTRFMKYMYAIYYDVVSHYPNCFTTRNLSIGSMFGDVVRILRNVTGDVVETSRWRDKLDDQYVSTLGGINLAIVNEDPVTYGHRVMNLPSMGDIAHMVVPSDSEPVFKPNYVFRDTMELDKKTKKTETVMVKVLVGLNREILPTSAVENGIIDTHKLFLISDGDTTYMRSFINYDWKGNSIWDNIKYKHSEINTVLSGFKSGVLTFDNGKLVAPQSQPPEFCGPFTMFTEDEIERIGAANTFTAEMKFGNKKAFVPSFQLYFPFDYYVEQKTKGYEDKGIDKYAIVSDFRYRVIERDQTFTTELQYEIKHGLYELTVTQVIDWVNID